MVLPNDEVNKVDTGIKSTTPLGVVTLTVIRHIEGYLAYWDELLRRHPDMFIDNCSSGGRRLDLESVRRSISLWRTDYSLQPIGTQCCSYGISLRD